MSMLLTGSNAAHAILDPEANPLTARVIASICDIALVIDGNGVIVEINASAEFEALPAFRELVGQRWIDHLTKDSHAKAEHLLTEARRGQTSRSREMNMRIAGLFRPYHSQSAGHFKKGPHAGTWPSACGPMALKRRQLLRSAACRR